MRKIISTVLIVALVLGFAVNAFALELKATSTTSTAFLSTSRSRAGFTIADGVFSSFGSATKLTVRAYTTSGTKNSNAKTYISGSSTGGADYFDATVLKVTMWVNTDNTGWASVSGTWKF